MTFLQHTFIKPWATAASQEGPALGPAGTSSLLRVAGSGERLGTHRCLLGESGAMEKEKQISRRSSSFTGGSRECSLRVAFQQRPEGRDGGGGSWIRPGTSLLLRQAPLPHAVTWACDPAWQMMTSRSLAAMVGLGMVTHPSSCWGS